MKKIKLKLDIVRNKEDSKLQQESAQRHAISKSMVLSNDILPLESEMQQHSEGDSIENISFQLTSPMIEFPEPNKVNSRFSEPPFKHPLTHKTSRQIEINKGDFMEDTNTALKNIISEANGSNSDYSSANIGENIEASLTPIPPLKEIRSIKDASNSVTDQTAIKEIDEKEITIRLQQSKIEELEKRNKDLEGKIAHFEEKYRQLQSQMITSKQIGPKEGNEKEGELHQEDIKEADNTIQSYTSNATDQDQSNIVMIDTAKDDASDRSLKRLVNEKDKQLASYKEFILRLKECLVRILNTHNLKSKQVDEVTKSQMKVIVKSITSI